MDHFAVRGVRYEWTPWVNMERALLEPLLPREPGLYRIRREGRDELDYIGQTGVGIRRRVRMLRGIRDTVMPYRDPHTAAPALWALLQSTKCIFEVSGLPIAGPAPWRKALEAVAIAVYRQEAGMSPMASFGRMPQGYRISSGNNARLVAAGKIFRGGVASDRDASHLPGMPPVDGLGGDPQDATWCGHRWSPWVSLADYSAASGVGLYRIRSRGSDGLLYIGEGVLQHRLHAHLLKCCAGRPSRTRQELVFAEAKDPEFAYVAGEWHAHQRLELETDLIAAHLLALGRVPPAQFIG
jgi:hypothetical protein